MPIGAIHRLVSTVGAVLLWVAVGFAPAAVAAVPQDPPLGTLPITSQIQLISTRAVTDAQGNAWTYRFLRNYAYPCSVPNKDGSVGYFTFLLATRDSQPRKAVAPLWVKVHGGGIGAFSPAGDAIPTAKEMDEETFDDLVGYVDKGLTGTIRTKQTGQPFRILVVSMCNHDIYGGGGQVDSLNPTLLPDGSRRQVSGLFATKAAITWTLQQAPTDDYFLHGTSAGGAGVLHLGWAMQLQGSPPAGIVTDSGLINQEAELARYALGGSCPAPLDEAGRLAALERLHPDVADPANEPDRLIASGRLVVPVAHVWNMDDKNTCGATTMVCPLHDGTTPTLGAAVCHHTPMRTAILARPATDHHLDLELCVPDSDGTACGRHVLTDTPGLRSSIGPKDYLTKINAWVTQRRADDPV